MKENPTKTNIRNIAIDLFKQNGFDNVTLNDICTLAGVSKHTFYYYFDSKDHLIMDLMNNLLTLDNQEMLELFIIASPYKQFKTFMDLKARHFISLGKEIIKKVLVARLTSSFDTDCQKEESTLIIYLIKLIGDAQEKGEILNNSDPMTLVKASLSVLIGVGQIWATHDGKRDFDLMVEYNKVIDAIMIVNPEKVIE